MYGSTETQRAVGYFEVPPETVTAAMKEVIPVGRGMKDVDLIVLNNANKPVGVGEVGGNDHFPSHSHTCAFTLYTHSQKNMHTSSP